MAVVLAILTILIFFLAKIDPAFNIKKMMRPGTKITPVGKGDIKLAEKDALIFFWIFFVFFLAL